MARQGHYADRSIQDLNARFAAKVHKTEGCWLWTGFVDGKGYGVFGVGDRRLMKAHRFSYEQHVGPVPDGLMLDHLCRVRNRVNPAHLEAVTNRENVIRGTAARGPATQCRRGHPLSGENVYLNPNGRRECKTCRRDATNRFIERKGTAQCAA